MQNKSELEEKSSLGNTGRILPPLFSEFFSFFPSLERSYNVQPKLQEATSLGTEYLHK